MLNQDHFYDWAVVALFAVSLLFVDPAFSAEQRKAGAGPIPIVNQSPIQLLFLQPVPDKAEAFSKGHGRVRLVTTVTNSLMSGTSANYEGTLDLETLRTSLDAAFGVSSRLELGVTIPFCHYYDGMLDGFVHDVEEAYGNVRGIRETEERNTFTYSVEENGNSIISGSENTVGLGDVILRMKASVFEQAPSRPALSARVSVKLPTGRKGRGFGSGEPDWGIGLLLQKDLKSLNFYLNSDVIVPGEAFDDLGVSLREFYTLMLGVEYRITPRFSALSQASFLSRPFKHTGLAMLDRRIYALTLGLSYRIQEDYLIQGGLVEDILDSQDATADVTFFLNVGVGF